MLLVSNSENLAKFTSQEFDLQMVHRTNSDEILLKQL